MPKKLTTLTFFFILLGHYIPQTARLAYAAEVTGLSTIAFLGQTQDTNADGKVDGGDSTGIYIVPQQVHSGDGLQYIELTSPFQYNVQAMAWSPSHNEIAFIAFFHDPIEQGGPSPSDLVGIFIVYPSSHGVLSIFEAPTGTRLYNLDWSADGQYLLYTAKSPGDDGHVYVVNRAGGEATRITQPNTFASLAQFVTPPTESSEYHILVQSGASDILRSGRKAAVELRRIGFSPDQGATYDEVISLPAFSQTSAEAWLSGFSVNQDHIALQIATGSPQTYDWVLSIQLGSLNWSENRPNLDVASLTNASPTGLNADNIQWGDGFLTYTVLPHYPATEPSSGVYVYDFIAKISTPLDAIKGASVLPLLGTVDERRFLITQQNRVSLMEDVTSAPIPLFVIAGNVLDIRLEPPRLKLITFHAFDVDTNEDGILNDLDYASIWVVDETGNRLSRLTGPDTYDIDPIWDPSGEWIAFTTIVDRDGDEIIRSDERRVIEVMRADGSQRHRVSPIDQETLAPFWSLDGTHLIFAARTSADRPYVTYSVPVGFDAGVSAFGTLPICMATSTTALNVRTAPIDGRVIGVLDTGNTAQITGVNGNREWLRINFGGDFAWVSRGYVNMDCSDEIIGQYPVVQGNEPVELNDGPIVLTTPETNSRPVVITPQGIVVENGVGQLGLLENESTTPLDWLSTGEVFGSVSIWSAENEVIGLVSRGDNEGILLRSIHLGSGETVDTESSALPENISFFEPLAPYSIADYLALVVYIDSDHDGTIEPSPTLLDVQSDQRVILEFNVRNGTTRQLSASDQSAWSPNLEVNGTRLVYSNYIEGEKVRIGWLSLTEEPPIFFPLTPDTLSAFNPRWQP